jgi:hypothetical protein
MEQSLQDLARKLLTDLERLNAGDLSVEDIAPLADDAREIYERLIALRYVAIERAVKGDTTEDNRDRAEETPFRLSPVLPGQTSLIDAIEEVINSSDEPIEAPVTEVAPPKEVETDEEDQEVELPAESVTSGRQAETKEEHVLPEPAKVEPEVAKPAATNKTKATAKAIANENTVAERLRRTPIEDLRKAIGLNQKFQFINDLFSGDSTRYNLLIDEVNSAPSLDDAMALLGHANDRLDSPDEDDKVAQTLVQLVERRFL